MSGFNSKAFVAQDRLLARIQSIGAPLAAYSIDFGLPAGKPDELHIWVDEEATSWNQDPELTGLTSVEERFSLTVYVYSRRTGATAAEVRDEISTAMFLIGAAIAAEPTLGGLLMYCKVTNLEYQGAFADSEGQRRVGYLKIVVGCSAWLTLA